MSIEDNSKKGKPHNLPDEEEFAILPIEGSGAFRDWKKHAFVLLVIILAATCAFGLGRLLTYEKDRTPITVSDSDERALKANNLAEKGLDDSSLKAAATEGSKASTETAKAVKVPPKTPSKTEAKSPQVSASSTNDYSGTVVGSKTGTKYYFPWCGSANRILATNKVYFANAAVAKAAGLLPSSTCKGLK